MIKSQIIKYVIDMPEPIPDQQNVATMCKVTTSTKSTNHRPTVANKSIQTDEIQEETAIIPVPVPIFVPTPMWRYSMPYPAPLPFPIPVPIPIFIPTTRNSASGIIKEIKEIQAKIPDNPLEAELIMMAEMIAPDKKEENTDSESEDEKTAEFERTVSPKSMDASSTFGNDMLEMALKMASELDESTIEAESAALANLLAACTDF